MILILNQAFFHYIGVKMRVLHILKTNVGAVWAYRQIKELKSMGIEVIVMMPEDDTGFALEYKKIGVEVVKFNAALPIRKPLNIIKMSKEFKRIIEDLKPDIIHCHFVTNIMFARIALRKSKIPRLFQVPGPLHLENIFFRYAEILLSKKNDYWAGSCQKTCKIYKKSGISKNRIFFGYYAGDFDKYATSSKRTGKLRKEYNIGEEEFLIGTVSYFYKPKYFLFQTKGIKGHEDFIKAFSILQKKHANVRGIIIGGPAHKSEKYMERLKRKTVKKFGDKIIFTGFRNDILDIYPDLDLAVHPSRSENYGGSGESLSMAVPTLTSNIGGFPDFIKEGKTGYMFKVKNSKDMARKMDYIINNFDEAKQTAINGQEFIITINSKLSAKQAAEMYDAIMKGEKQ